MRFVHSFEIKKGEWLLSIRELRARANMTQEQLAKKMNVDQSTVSLWETGKTFPMKKLHKKLAKVLGCSVDELMSGVRQ
jgi:transcriptional regulator with XRE-family HTH domain